MDCELPTIGHAIAEAIQSGEIEEDDNGTIFKLATGLAALYVEDFNRRGPESIDVYSYVVGMATMLGHAQVVIDELQDR